jgi:hypothetical protein
MSASNHVGNLLEIGVETAPYRCPHPVAEGSRPDHRARSHRVASG